MAQTHRCIVGYAPGMDAGAGHEWYRQVLAGMERELPGVRAVRSFAARTLPPREEVPGSLRRHHRMTELDVGAGWDGGAAHDALLQGCDEVTTFLSVTTAATPEYDLLQEAPAEQEPFRDLPVRWRHGGPPPQVDASADDPWRYLYLFGYRSSVGFAGGERWYLGHHVREGLALPGVLRYLTWRRVGRESDVVRFTELTFGTFEAWYRACVSDRPEWRMPEGCELPLLVPYAAIMVGDAPDVDLGEGAG